MSKETTIRCNGCNQSATGTGYSTLWARLKRHGWVHGKNHTAHFCSEACRKKAEEKEK